LGELYLIPRAVMPAVLLPQPREQIHRIIVGLVDCDAVLGEPHPRGASPISSGGVIAVRRNHPTFQKFFAALLIFATNRGERNPVGRFDHRHGISLKDRETG
jgi:hypothetical protein